MVGLLDDLLDGLGSVKLSGHYAGRHGARRLLENGAEAFEGDWRGPWVSVGVRGRPCVRERVERSRSGQHRLRYTPFSENSFSQGAMFQPLP